MYVVFAAVIYSLRSQSYLALLVTDVVFWAFRCIYLSIYLSIIIMIIGYLLVRTLGT